MRAGWEQGASVLEALLALFLLSLVIQGGWTVFVRSREAGLKVARRAEALETIRTIAWLLPEEVSGGRAGLDWRVEGGDSLTLRAFRGLALMEGNPVPTRVVRVCFRGIRTPDPEKDSVLVLGVDGRWRVNDLEDRHRISSSCPDVEKGWEEEWTLASASSGGVLARLFERGSYHLADGAIRYRRGEGGRQPLTPERIQDGRFLGPEEGGRPFGWEIALRGAPGGRRASGGSEALSWRGGGS